ncbi:hypothetical protein [Actinomadura rugatobispora]|uniref:Uncharacterized protein n=1 Tax=Actinomadura rugatobispora TaxID=1994 RepID=A0ABW0ZRX1_9ACTN|nr:hypothetical protein GCM10010200_036180 [Actinomadura rugatobispora]
MGTNYYTRAPACENACAHCSREQYIHLGKVSAGWRFLHRAYRDHQPDGIDWPVNDRPSWLRLVSLGPIEDEYGQELSRAEFLARIDSMQGGIARDSARARDLCGPGYDAGLRNDFTSEGYDFCDSDFS